MVKTKYINNIFNQNRFYEMGGGSIFRIHE
jgi:hypothetical protein